MFGFGGVIFGLQFFLGVLQTFVSGISSLIDKVLTTELVSLQMYPHTSYNIVTGIGTYPGVCPVRSHYGPAVVYIGSNVLSTTVRGSAVRSGRYPFIPIVSSIGRITKVCWTGAVAEQQQNAGSIWHAFVKFKTVDTTKVLSPPFALHDVHFIGIMYLRNLLSTGILLGPPTLVALSNLVSGFIMKQQVKASSLDFQFAMTPQSLTQYSRVE